MTDHTPLTNALSDQRKHTLLFFQSSGCNLCRSISSRVEEVVVVDRNSPISSVLLFCQAGPHYSFDAQERLQLESHLNLVHINTDGAQGFAPEVRLQCGGHLNLCTRSVPQVADAGGLFEARLCYSRLYASNCDHLHVCDSIKRCPNAVAACADAAV